MNAKNLFVALVVLASSAALAQTTPQNQPPVKQKSKNHVAVPAARQHQDEGDRIFQQNCSRCHNAPEGFSPRIAGTIARHMRVRASLSEHDTEELLHFINP